MPIETRMPRATSPGHSHTSFGKREATTAFWLCAAYGLHHDLKGFAAQEKCRSIPAAFPCKELAAVRAPRPLEALTAARPTKRPGLLRINYLALRLRFRSRISRTGIGLHDVRIGASFVANDLEASVHPIAAANRDKRPIARGALNVIRAGRITLGPNLTRR